MDTDLAEIDFYCLFTYYILLVYTERLSARVGRLLSIPESVTNVNIQDLEEN